MSSEPPINTGITEEDGAPVAGAQVEDASAEQQTPPTGPDLSAAPPPVLPEDLPQTEQDAQAAQAAAAIAQMKEQMTAYLKDLQAKLDADVAAGRMDPTVRDIVLKAENLRMDEDLLSRRGVIQISYRAFWSWLQTCFEFSTLLAGGRVKSLTMHNNQFQDTIDIVFCHEDLQPVPEGEMPPFVRMPEIPWNDFQMLMAMRKKDAKLLQQILRQSGWEVNISDAKSKIIVPGQFPQQRP